MQTFLPFPSFRESAIHLDKQRLNKQITECLQLLRANVGNGGWNHHPVARMWKGYEAALIEYADEMYQYFVEIGGAASHKSMAQIVTEFAEYDTTPVMPPWLGDERLHSSHRSRLLHKGNLDTLRKRLRLLDKEPDKFCSEFFNTRLLLRDLKVAQCNSIHRWLDARGIHNFSNFYYYFNWAESPGDDYFWPDLTMLEVAA